MAGENPFLVFLEVLWLLIRVAFYFLESFFRVFVPTSEKEIRGHLVLVTGAGAGIGRELAIRLANRGAKLVLWDINQEAVEETALMAREYGVQARAYRCDVTDRKAVLDLSRKVRQDMGHVEVLINNAGILLGGALTDLSEADIRKSMDVNTLAHFWTLQAFLPSMMERNSGHVVTIASIAAKVGSPYLSVYHASKWACYGLTESLKAELNLFGTNGVRTTTICPIYVNTGLVNNQPNLRVSQRFGRVLEPGEVADATISGFLRNEDIVYIPKSLRRTGLILETWPLKAQAALAQFLQTRFVDSSKEKMK